MQFNYIAILFGHASFKLDLIHQRRNSTKLKRITMYEVLINCIGFSHPVSRYFCPKTRAKIRSLYYNYSYRVISSFKLIYSNTNISQNFFYFLICTAFLPIKEIYVKIRINNVFNKEMVFMADKYGHLDRLSTLLHRPIRSIPFFVDYSI